MSVNKVILLGNCTKDPDIKHLDNSSVANFSIATNERGYTTKSGQTIPERVEYHNLVVWGGLTKVVESYVKKGTQLYIEGKLRTRSWDDKDGNKRYATEVNVDNLQLLGGNTNNQSNQSQSQSAPQSTHEPQINDENSELPS